ncbi:MAG: M14 family zinc carboxypeptidase [Gemmatimonadota bacterium]|nr:M14 family zinc carboxypeptidase [Gemmatimonadota bacterium]
MHVARVSRPLPAERARARRAVSHARLVIVAGLAFASPLAASPLHAQVPTPESVLGFPVGADFELATYEQSLAYFQRLDAASDRVELREIGSTSFGRPWYIALISSEENLRDAERYREIARRLAYPEPGMTDADARALAAEGKAIVHIDGGLHASEVAHAQHTIQLAYDLVTGDDDPEIRQILDDVILVLWFSINPDGQTMVSDWYYSNLGTPYEVASTPFLYQKYIGHDNNRDGYMINQIESRVVTRVDRHWEPQIIYNHHQSSPFPTRIWIPPFAEPISPNVHPLMWRTVNLIGMSMAQALEERGQKGAVHMGSGFDNWYPGFMDHANNFHNVASFLTETALYRYATPHFYTIGDFPQDQRDLRPQSLYASPWEGGWWRVGDAVDYMITASISVLDVAAKYKEDLLFNRYQAARDVTEQYRSAPPYAFFIPQDQRDPVAAVEMLRRLAFNGIDVHRLSAPVTFDGVTHAAGTWVIAMDQPNANFVRQLFAVQDYPDLREYPEGPPEQPYDVSGWTLPYQFDVRVVEARTPLGADVRGALEMIQAEALPWNAEGDAQPWDSPPGVGFDSHPVARGIVPPEGRISGGGGALVLDAAENNGYKALSRAWAEGARVGFRPGAAATEEGEAGTSGAWTIEGLSGAQRGALVSELRLQASAGSAGSPVARPRVGLYRPWNASMDEGWTRWLFEMYEVGFASLRNADVRAGELRARYDVIVLADIGARSIVEGFAKGSVPARYEGGIGQEGVRALEAFVRAGGTLVTINGSSQFAIDNLHLPVRNVVREVEREEYFVGGAIVELLVDPSHPVMSGMPERAKVFVGSSPVFTTEEGFEGRVFAKYPENGSPLLSGYFLGEELVNGYGAAVEVEHGQGRVVLLGMRPQWRGQPFGTFKVLFNAALYSGAVASQAPDNPGFWTAPEEEEAEGENGSGNGR